ncbi:KxDL motif-containing protein 1 [Halocaridina rubra]|uniref:KxDL motif-containing protein 1 n=1 Tax=Halocaridina rubra TaxID=373956 RepID=A0AAN8X7P8_HALRR
MTRYLMRFSHYPSLLRTYLCVIPRTRLQRFEKTNEMLSNCNALSATRFALAQKEFKKHTALLVDMKKDLDNIFKRIRTIKTKLSNQYPTAFAMAQEKVFKEADEDEDTEANNLSQKTQECTEGANKRSSVSGESAQSGHSSKSEHVEDMEQSSDGSRADTERQMKKTASSSSDSSSSAKLSSSSSFDN